ncbi:uncharacterized protein BP5553_06786 [Venustampulla echinocandica]|uniref:Uncharacterized protein n=1 Tax=Venustampulla echinocandica TaxID=2656787 RepID=A0A370TKX4_9HELO|nr:uncharacterized protein BP5553_06786 [Venustampulla echinocandica]RDL36174.1 hypothetical protein BP5553_06786 [Venustampulla echinocandica]
MRATTLSLVATFAVTTLAQDSFSLGAPTVSLTIADPTETGTIGFTDTNENTPTGDASLSSSVAPTASTSDSDSVSIVPTGHPTGHPSKTGSEHHSSHDGRVTVTVTESNCVATPTNTFSHGHTKSHSNGTAVATKTGGGKVTTALLSHVGSTAAVPTKPLPSNPVPVSGAGKMRLGAGVMGLVALVAGMQLL